MYKLLLVDDFFVERENVKDIINEFNIELDIIAEVENGKQALEVIEENCPDFILTDIEMPIMNGIELAEIVHKKYPQIKIIFFSFYNKFEYAQRAISFDVHAYILKPIVPEEMIVSLKKIIQQKKQEELQSKEQLELKKLVAESYPLLVNQFKLDLFMGRYKQEEDIFRRLNYLNIPYKTAVDYAVVVLELDSYSTIMNSKTLDEIDMLEILVSKIIEKTALDFDSTLFTRVEDNHWAILINGEAGDSSAQPRAVDQINIEQVSIEQKSIQQVNIGQTQIIECSNTNQDQLAELYNKSGDFSMQLLKELSEHNISASIGISSSFTSLLEVSKKFKEGLYALEFKYGLGNGQIIEWMIFSPPQKYSPFPQQILKVV